MEQKIGLQSFGYILNGTINRQTIWSTGGNSSAVGMTMRIESGALGGSNGDAISAQMSKASDGSWLFWGSGSKH